MKFDDQAPYGLEAIFAFSKLSDLRKHCRKIVIYGDDFANLIVRCSVLTSPIGHMPIYRHHHPDHLALSDDDLAALVRNEAGPMGDAAMKAARKIRQMFNERRLFCGHLFWQIHEALEKPSIWHFFHFDEKSTSARSNHWKHGSHIHLMNHLTHADLALDDLLDTLDREARPWLSGGLHLRYHR